MHINDIYLGKRVVSSMHINAEICIIKRIDTEEQAVFIVPINGNIGGWHSISCIYSTKQ